MTPGRTPRGFATATAVAGMLLLGGCVGVDLPSIRAPSVDTQGSVLPPRPTAGFDLDRPYDLLPGDEILIAVAEDPTLDIQVQVASSGEIEILRSETAPGEPRRRIVARGRTTEQLQEDIADVYTGSRFQSRPYVRVKLVTPVPRRVYVIGAVRAAPSMGYLDLPLGRRMTLTQAIMACGGEAEDADLRAVKILRKDPATQAEIALPPYDVSAMLAQGLLDRDPPLEPNDTIVIPKVGSVTIWGNVNQAGRHLCRPGLRLTDLFALAGGLKDFSDLAEVRVTRDEGTRNERTYNVNVNDILAGRADDPVLQPGDRVFVKQDWK